MENSRDNFQAPVNPFGDPFGHEANVQVYQPPDIRSGAWTGADAGPNLDDDAYDEPFSAAHLAAAHQASVPAVVTPPPPASSKQLAFTGIVRRRRIEMVKICAATHNDLSSVSAFCIQKRHRLNVMLRGESVPLQAVAVVLDPPGPQGLQIRPAFSRPARRRAPHCRARPLPMWTTPPSTHFITFDAIAPISTWIPATWWAGSCERWRSSSAATLLTRSRPTQTCTDVEEESLS